MKNYLNLLIVLLHSFYAFPQNSTDFGRVYTDTLPQSFKVSISEVRDHIYNGIPENLKPKDYPALSYKFAGESAKYYANLLKSGSVYSDWPTFENYINAVLQKVIPVELKDDPEIYAYLLKDGGFNAFMLPSGKTFFNIGAFGEMESEATLAGILCHELAHYYLKHTAEGYKKSVEGDFKPGFMMLNRRARSNFSVDNEIDSDSLAMVWMHQAGYNPNGLLSAFRAFERKEENTLLRYQDIWKLKEVSHPSSERRQQLLQKFIEDNKANTGSYYLVDETKFTQLKAKAKPEILKHLLYNFQYNLCIEKAFKYHLFDTENPTYVYYIMEAIRRKCYLDNTKWNKNFITYRYFKVKGEGKKKHKIPYENHLFTQLPLDILRLSAEMAEKIEAKFYWEGEVKFKTYEQAFHFFSKVGNLLENPECILSNALSFSSNKKVMNQLLNEYLKQDKIHYRKYAELLLKDDIKATLPGKKLSVLNEFNIISRNGKTHIWLNDHNTNGSNFYNNFLTKVTTGLENCETLYLPDWQSNRLNDYIRLKELETLTSITLIARGERTELHILDPRYWQLFKDLGINEVEFINCIILDVEKKLDQSLGFYKKIMNSSYSDLLAATHKNRFTYLSISSVRSIERGVMKVSYNQGETKLKFKQPAYEQVVKQVNENLQLKHAKAMDLDSRTTY